MSDASGRAEYSIAAVSKLTGISCHALRVWERRYGFPVPQRSASGHRRYTLEQAHVLHRIAALARDGRSISELIGEARAGALAAVAALEVAAVSSPREAAPLLERLLGGDMLGAESEYSHVTAGLTAAEQLERVLEPGFVDAGERLFRQECLLSQERCACGFLRRKLLMLLDAAQRDNHQPKWTVLTGTVQGDRHEGGALMFSLMLELAGIRTLFVGSDMPVPAFHDAVDRWRPVALGLSFVLSRNINKRFREIARIRQVPVFVGGRSILNYQGLARRHGLIPLPGTAQAALGPFLAHLKSRLGEAAARTRNGKGNPR